MLLASWCNERSVRTIGHQWRAGPNSGVLVQTVACWSQKWRAGPNSGVLVPTVACRSQTKCHVFSNGMFHCNHRRQKMGCYRSFQHSQYILRVEFGKVMVVKCRGKEKVEWRRVFRFFVAKKAVKIRTLSSSHFVFVSCRSVCPPVTPIKLNNRFSVSFTLRSFTKIRQLSSILVLKKSSNNNGCLKIAGKQFYISSLNR